MHVKRDSQWLGIETSPATWESNAPVSRVTGGDTYHYTTEDKHFEEHLG